MNQPGYGPGDFEPSPEKTVEDVMELIDSFFDDARMDRTRQFERSFYDGERDTAGRLTLIDSQSLRIVGLDTDSERILLTFPYKVGLGRSGSLTDRDSTEYPPDLLRLAERPMHVFFPHITSEDGASEIYIIMMEPDETSRSRKPQFFTIDKVYGVRYLPAAEGEVADIVSEEAERYLIDTLGIKLEEIVDIKLEKTFESENTLSDTSEALINAFDLIDPQTMTNFWFSNLDHRALTRIES